MIIIMLNVLHVLLVMSKKMDIMNFINSIEDSLTREIFRCKYIDCHTGKQVGILNCVSKDYARRVVREYLQKK